MTVWDIAFVVWQPREMVRSIRAIPAEFGELYGVRPDCALDEAVEIQR